MKKITIILIIVISFFFISCDKDSLKVEYLIKEGQDTVEINSEWNDAGVVFKFNNQEVKGSISSNDIDVSKLGIYTVKYKATYQDKDYFISKKVAIVDETKPVLELNPGIDTISVGEEWVDAGVLVTDNSLEELDYIVDGEVEKNAVGRYIITYTAKDSSNNQSRIIRVVNVVN